MESFIRTSFMLGIIIVARNPESLVRKVLAERLEIQFTADHAKLGDWGLSDGEAKLSDQTLLLLEVESTQKHPSTNVLKVWPFLEENKSKSVLLVHAFFEDSPGRTNSRGELANWLAHRMQDILGSRFVYRRIILSRDGEQIKGFSELQAEVLRRRSDVSSVII